MAGGNISPRQKMINMMYLVLTALLAMNVSKEILNAFVSVNNSIQKSNSIMASKNEATYKAFANAEKDPQTAAKAKKVANAVFHIIVATMLIASGVTAVKAFKAQNVSLGTLEAALTAIKGGEVKAFLSSLV